MIALLVSGVTCASIFCAYHVGVHVGLRRADKNTQDRHKFRAALQEIAVDWCEDWCFRSGKCAKCIARRALENTNEGSTI